MAIETVPGFEFACRRPGCGVRSPALRRTRREAESDEAAHENIMHADSEVECLKCGEPLRRSREVEGGWAHALGARSHHPEPDVLEEKR